MLGLKYIKNSPTTYLFKYQNGQLQNEGVGLSFFYYAPITTLVSVSIGSEDVPFIFEETSSDFQTITIQGQVSYKITDVHKIAKLMDFAIDSNTQKHISHDPQKLPQKVINQVQVITNKAVAKLSLADVLISVEEIAKEVYQAIPNSAELNSLGIEILSFSLLAIRPNPETSRALEAEARENLLKKADEAIYSRRNASVEQERAIKENELNTEIAVENKKREIQEAQMEAKKAIQAQKHKLKESKMNSKIIIEEKNSKLVDLAMVNAKKESDAKAYALEVLMKSLENVDTKTIQAITSSGMSPDQLIAQSFQDLANSSQKIGQLNITPDLLKELLNKDK